MTFRHFLTLAVIALLALSAAARAAETDPRMQLLFLGASPEEGAPGALPRDLPLIALPDLPAVEAAQQAVFAARLRASPVSTFVSTPTEANAQFEQFYLIGDVTLAADGDGYKLGVGAETFALEEFAARVSAVIDAFSPRYRRIGFLRVTDAEDRFPMAIAQVQQALNGIGFDMMVVMIGADRAGASCSQAPAQSLHYSIVSGLADRAPFGNGDGISTAAEVETYLTRALNRLAQRDPVCGPKYSLIVKASNDPAQELVAYGGRAAFTEMETGLYNETFEAMFLMDSQDRDSVQGYLASCLYCPSERDLTERLRDMEEFARASALESDIWNRIKDDTEPARLAIYLENCGLCTYREEVKARILQIDAKARAFDQEARLYDAAVSARDIDALRSYAKDCVACAFQSDASKLVAEIEADKAYQAEKASMAAALDSGSPDMMRAYLDNCSICEGREEIAAALELAVKRAEIAAPCLALAAVPQYGGPRKLESIDREAALPVCEAAAKEFPNDGLIRTTLGRIAQAAADFETAAAAYDFGMKAGEPSAFGLAAYSHYAPPADGEIDLDAAVALAQQGAERGDWLSQEILTVLYSKDLVPGKTAEDAFAIAKAIADEGNALAQFFVGYYYLTGTGTELSQEDAALWLGKSVDQGYTHAYSFLAELYETGTGAELAADKAAELYWNALNLGDPTATDRLTTQLGNRNREVIRIIQQRLREQGAYRGLVDGIAGPGTVAAIRRYSESLTSQG